MRGGRFYFSPVPSDAHEAEKMLKLEAQELRRARIMNGAEPDMKNGEPKAADKEDVRPD